eukprot:Gb_37061 [translate_table: standard]
MLLTDVILLHNWTKVNSVLFISTCRSCEVVGCFSSSSMLEGALAVSSVLPSYVRPLQYRAKTNALAGNDGKSKEMLPAFQGLKFHDLTDKETCALSIRSPELLNL